MESLVMLQLVIYKLSSIQLPVNSKLFSNKSVRNEIEKMKMSQVPYALIM